MAKIIPFGKNIYVQPLVKEQVLVSDDEVLCTYGTVISIGENVKTIKVGDIIGYDKFGVKDIEVNSVKNYLIPEDSDFLLCTIEL